VASTVCGRYAGVAKKSTCIAVKVMKDSGLGTVFDITDGVSWVATAHRNSTNKSVANMSLGSPIPNPIIDARSVHKHTPESLSLSLSLLKLKNFYFILLVLPLLSAAESLWLLLPVTLTGMPATPAPLAKLT
jgi:hypothetical protein